MQNLALEILKKEKPYLEEHFGVTEIGIFGSFARGDNMPDSDIDIIVKVKKISFANIMGVLNYLETIFNRKVDLVIHGKNISTRFLNFIQKELIYA